MRELGLTGLSEDGRFLIAHDSLTDESFLIPTDIRLTSLLGASSTGTAKHPDEKPGPREPSMETTLSPRDIQTRIRRGESAEQVAESSGMPVEKVRAFAIPVIAEREFIVEQARKTTVRQMRSGSGPGQLLGDLVDDSVTAAGLAAESAAWDSWRREDGRWTVVIGTEILLQPATFLFDVKGRYILPVDDAALELIGDFMEQESPDMAIASAVREDPKPDVAPIEAEPVAEAVAESVDDEIDAVLADSVMEELVEELQEVELTFEVGVDEYLEPSAQVSSLKEARDRRALEQLAMSIEAEAAPSEVSDVEITEEHDIAIPATHPSKRKHERRRVPSWDEIMFGGSHD
jgi:hypothetical protein